MPQVGNIKKIALPALAAYAVYRFAPQQAVKGAALGVLGVLVARNLPIIGGAFCN